jgi:hypothetical protein
LGLLSGLLRFARNDGQQHGWRMETLFQLKARQSTLRSKSHKLGVRSHAGLGLDQIVIVLNGLDADVEICGDLLRR